MRKWILAATYTCGAALALWMVASTSDAKDEIPSKYKKKFAKLDTNKDGRLQRSEVPEVIDDALFERGDRDKDGALTGAEAYRVALIHEATKKARKTDGKLRNKIAKIDKNGDGVVVKSEFPADDALFDKLDRDGNQKITMPEALAYFLEEEIAKVFAKHDADMSGTLSEDEVPDDAKGVFVAADVNEDGEVTGKEAFDFLYAARMDAETKAPTTPKGDESPSAEGLKKAGVLGVLLATFNDRDRNHDGHLDGAEFSGSSELLKRMDVDRDGRVSRVELQLRLQLAKDLGVRGERLKALSKRLGVEKEFAAIGTEAKGLFEAGRYAEVRELMDVVELELLKREKAAK